MPEYDNHYLLQKVEYLKAMVLYGITDQVTEALCDVNLLWTDMQEGQPIP